MTSVPRKKNIIYDATCAGEARSHYPTGSTLKHHTIYPSMLSGYDPRNESQTFEGLPVFRG